MKYLFAVSIILISICDAVAQLSKSDSTEYLAQKLIKEFDKLPRTLPMGKDDWESVSEYSMDWHPKSMLLGINVLTYTPEGEKLPAEFKVALDVRTLHKEGIQIRNHLSDSTLNLDVRTANNDQKIKQYVYKNGGYVFGSNQDGYGIGPWDSSVVYSQLSTIKILLRDIVRLNTDWGDEDRPDFTLVQMPEMISEPGRKEYSVQIDQDIDAPIYMNQTLDSPALFKTAKSANDNDDLVNAYILEKLKEQGVEFTGLISFMIILSDSGEVEDVKLYKMNEPKVEAAVKEIVIAMPKWKPGLKDGSPARASENFIIR